MQLIKITKGLVDNLGVKLIALVVALVIWFNASGQQEVSKHYIASLSFANIPDSLTTVGGIPDKVELIISGTRPYTSMKGYDHDRSNGARPVGQDQRRSGLR